MKIKIKDNNLKLNTTSNRQISKIKQIIEKLDNNISKREVKPRKILFNNLWKE